MNDIIIGAGVTGLAAGYKTGFEIYEAKEKPGGICRSYYENNYRFEIGGGHWIFGDFQIWKFINEFAEVKRYQRKAGVYINNIFSYPIQNKDYRDTVKCGTMKAWLLKQFGYDMCKMFFFPFNKKYTNGLYEMVIQDDPKKSPKRGMLGYNREFVYPKQGLDYFIDRLAECSTIKYDKKAVKLDIKKRIIKFKDGEEVNYKRLISTIPLNQLLDMAGIDNNLPYTSVDVMNIGATPGSECPKEHWLYIPFSKDNIYRVGFYSNVDKSFAPKDKVSIYVEGHNPKNVLEELFRYRFIKETEIVSLNNIKVAYTWLYPKHRREYYLRMLKENGIESIGRYGKWRFQGIAESILDGLSL